MAPVQPTVDGAGYATIFNANQSDFDNACHNFDMDSPKSLIDFSISFSSQQEILYTAVWAPDLSGLDIDIAGGYTADKFQQWVQTCNTQGRRITTISATGSGVDARFAGVAFWGAASKSVVNTVLLDLNNQTQQRWERAVRAAGGNMQMSKSYGTTESPRHATLFHFSPDHLPMGYWTTGSAADLTNYKGAYEAMKIYSPYWVTGTRERKTVYYSPRAVGNWELQTNIYEPTMSQYLQKLAAQGLHPICIQQVDSAYYDVIAAQTWPPVAREWTIVGSNPSQNVENALVTGLDSLFRNFMQANNVRHAQVAIGTTTVTPGAQNTNIYVSRAYTWSQPDSYVTQTTDRFLLASISKAFSIQAVNMIIQGVGLAPGKAAPTLNSPIFHLLGYKGKSPRNAKLFDITINHCVTMYSGFDDKAPYTFDPTYKSRQVAQWAMTFNKRPELSPIAMTDLIDYKFYNCDLDHNVGEEGYANINNVLLARLVEVSSGMSYMDYLIQHVLPPLTIASDVESANVGLSAIDPSSSEIVPAIYSGDDLSKECTVGSASLACSATTLIKFIGRCATWGIGERAAGFSRDGSMDGASTHIYSSDKNTLDLAIVLNTRDFGAAVSVKDLYAQVEALVDAAVVQDEP